MWAYILCGALVMLMLAVTLNDPPGDDMS